jgi:tetratricopeptide (TPR) repeat protein
MPNAGHIVHMPAHVYVRVGRYADAIGRNVHAVHADQQHLGDFAPDGAYRLAYHPHNHHFLWFAATMAGRRAQALDAARQTAAATSRDLLRAPGMAALQHYLVTPLYAMVRFGDWRGVLAEPAPPADLPYPTGVWHYARALALSATGDAAGAGRELAALEAARADTALASLRIWDLNRADALLDIAIAAVRGELAARRGDHAAAIAELRRGAAIEDRLTYDEPPTWHLPVRHQLGAVLLDARRPAEAERAYREDLRRHPENGWALRGLQQALAAQGRGAEAREVASRLAAAWRSADVLPHASRF